MAGVYAKETEQPLILRLDFFVIPWIICFFNDLIPMPPLDGFFSSLALILTWIVVSRRYKYLDQETGFYTEEFLSELDAYADRSRSKGGSVIIFETEKDENELAESIRASKPANSSVIKINKGRFLLISRVNEIKSLNYLIRIVCSEKWKNKINTDINAEYHILKENVTFKEFLNDLKETGKIKGA